MSKFKLTYLEAVTTGFVANEETISEAAMERKYGEIQADSLRLENFIKEGRAIVDLTISEGFRFSRSDVEIENMLEAAMPNWLKTLIEKIKEFFGKIAAFFKNLYSKFTMNVKKMRDIKVKADATLTSVVGKTFTSDAEIKTDPVKWENVGSTIKALLGVQDTNSVDTLNTKVKDLMTIYSEGKGADVATKITSIKADLEATRGKSSDEMTNDLFSTVLIGDAMLRNLDIDVKRGGKPVKTSDVLTAAFDDGDKKTYKGNEIVTLGKAMQKAIAALDFDSIEKKLKKGMDKVNEDKKSWDENARILERSASKARDKKDDEAELGKHASDVETIAKDFGAYSQAYSMAITTVTATGMALMTRLFSTINTIIGQLESLMDKKTADADKA
jgi:hypothetical protein